MNNRDYDLELIFGDVGGGAPILFPNELATVTVSLEDYLNILAHGHGLQFDLSFGAAPYEGSLRFPFRVEIRKTEDRRRGASGASHSDKRLETTAHYSTILSCLLAAASLGAYWLNERELSATDPQVSTIANQALANPGTTLAFANLIRAVDATSVDRVEIVFADGASLTIDQAARNRLRANPRFEHEFSDTIFHAGGALGSAPLGAEPLGGGAYSFGGPASPSIAVRYFTSCATRPISVRSSTRTQAIQDATRRSSIRLSSTRSSANSMKALPLGNGANASGRNTR